MMRDPDLVKRAERAAISLERAWSNWCAVHGLAANPRPPVSSYVGYSLEEPWGQPRVVFGVAAEEAERLAALLDGHDCVGPIYAEVTSRPDWRRVVNAGPASGTLPTSADPLGLDTRQHADAPAPANALATPGPEVRATAPVPRPPADDDSGWLNGAQSARDLSRSGRPAPGRDQRDGHADADALVSPADLESPLPDAAGSADAKPAIVAFRHRPEASDAGPDDAADNVATDNVPAAQPLPAAKSEPEVAPSQGPGYRGPRYQGFPPQYDASRAPDQERPAADPPAKTDEVADGEARPRTNRGRSAQVSRLGRAWRALPGNHEAADWPQDEHAATDTAV